MRVIFYSMAIIIVLSGCGFSARENMIRNQRPDYLKSHKSGPIASLTQRDIGEAIEFGKSNKHKQDVIDYAFIFAKNSSRLLEVNPRTLYISICTNFYLIADYAARQTRNYENIDMDYVNFLAHLPTFKIEAVEQMGDIFYPFQIGSKFVLLKDENKLAESKENPLYKSQSPYTFSHLSGQLGWQEAIVQQTIEMANKIAEAYQPDTKKALDHANSPLLTPSNLYNYKDIDLSSKYEVVIIYSDGEIHVPIDFSNVK